LYQVQGIILLLAPAIYYLAGEVAHCSTAQTITEMDYADRTISQSARQNFTANRIKPIQSVSLINYDVGHWRH
jgi:hypothetical protein